MRLYAAALDFSGIAEEFGIVRDFDEWVSSEAAAATDRYTGQRLDRRDIDLVTIDPEGSMDLDQAVCIRPDGNGYLVHYAIADVAAFVDPAGRVAAESLHRGQTIYLPDGPARLHPPELSEGAASLLPDVDRPAVLWSMRLDSRGEVTGYDLTRALVRSRARFNYVETTSDMENGRLHPAIRLLPEVGELRSRTALRRRAVSLSTPAQSVGKQPDGRYRLDVEPRLAMMEYNSEISLLTGMIAGRLMASAGVGILRTLAPAEPADLWEFAAEVAALGYAYDPADPIGTFLDQVDVTGPKGMAVMREAQKLLRGAGYEILTGEEGETQEEFTHAGVGGYYAHVTAPLRRLVDRYATEFCLAIHNGTPVPEWAEDGASDVLETMHRTAPLASSVDRACLNLAEATVLEPWVGETFSAVVLATSESSDSARIFIAEPPVVARCAGAPEQGTRVTVRLDGADIAQREVSFTWVP
ncbi:RNB domain-containing ribonuclease [Corynebacterium sp. CCM 9185]|uniref:RNB domain-containing ribonuclease n=1 Tax=Corynebacterium marambiense TaxID=2765364 RepID=A0ABS0VVZ3_9CORY|nr:RNB domain-containing ribonuclease [Corynebacterium marambiense]MBI9000937.1 RNB domain-containing ribonuclease [Corynebacterium marambiense]MCK7662792.1 RNB domain-containing ribonuclease [Corynebacterium marambiense]MCX7542401.1 RNB domain-containing ribonuclease [Corynebacterium marambiense]